MLLLTAKVSSRGSQERPLGTITHKGCCVGSGGHRGADRSPRRTETQLAGALRWSDRTRPGGAALLRARARELVAYAYANCSPRPAGATRCRSASVAPAPTRRRARARPILGGNARSVYRA